ncbi:type II toxin-antitoxin system VapC family toxin [Brunnivagina elsteri]|nr:PIN domain-containing protein [Calothrix elsteri]
MTEVFLDTSFAIALSSVTDQNHVRAAKLANQIETDGTCLVTTQAILLEIGNALSKQRYRAAAIQLLESLETDPSVEVVLLRVFQVKKCPIVMLNGAKRNEASLSIT